MGNIVTNPKAFYITKKPEYEYIMKKGFSAAFANADATPKYKGVPFALTDAREQLGRYGDCVIPVTLDGTYEVQRMQNGIDYVFVPLDSADKIHIDAPQKSVRLSESKLRKIVSESIKKMLSERYEPGDTLSIPPHKPIIKGKTPNGYDDEYAGMDNNVGVIMMNDISKILDEARYWYGVTTDSSVAEELGVVIDCLYRAFEATMNLSKMQID